MDPRANYPLTDRGEGESAAAAILRAMRLRLDPVTGKTVEIEVSPLTPAQEGRLMAALGDCIAAHKMTEADFVAEKTWTSLKAAIEANVRARTGAKRRG
jgi:hypothetical protein